MKVDKHNKIDSKVGRENPGAQPRVFQLLTNW